MSDLIERARDAAFEQWLVDQKLDKITPREGFAKRCFDAGVEYANRWTYCVDALPPKNGEYLVILLSGVVSTACWWTRWNNHTHVIAWRPLPEPTKV